MKRLLLIGAILSFVVDSRAQEQQQHQCYDVVRSDIKQKIHALLVAAPWAFINIATVKTFDYLSCMLYPNYEMMDMRDALPYDPQYMDMIHMHPIEMLSGIDMQLYAGIIPCIIEQAERLNDVGASCRILNASEYFMLPQAQEEYLEKLYLSKYDTHISRQEMDVRQRKSDKPHVVRRKFAKNPSHR